MKQKRLMLLGGIRYLLPVIEAAHKQGYYVLTVDYLPDNIAHRFSDEYVNVNIVDREAVLRAAIDKEIDGIMSFGVDPGVVSAAYVQSRMGLPAFGPLESVEILQNKDRFRAFLKENGFNVPEAKGYASVEEALEDAPSWTYPVIVKPTDSAGSKGVSRVDGADEMDAAVREAFSHSISGHVIIERFIEKCGCSSDSDSFLENGKLKFVSFSAQRFDGMAANPYTPSAYSWPATFSQEESRHLTEELQRLFTLLNMRTGVYNIETRVGSDGKPYIMEATPRGGGNRLAEMLRLATGVDMITACVRSRPSPSSLTTVAGRKSSCTPTGTACSNPCPSPMPFGPMSWKKTFGSRREILSALSTGPTTPSARSSSNFPTLKRWSTPSPISGAGCAS